MRHVYTKTIFHPHRCIDYYYAQFKSLGEIKIVLIFTKSCDGPSQRNAIRCES